ncbi:MAG: polysaccharide lyase beta-sandwich domain-containing protein, partial [Bacteroidales bacterium]
DHGIAPQKQGYEYMIMVSPSQKEQADLLTGDYYNVIRKDAVAHIVYDKKTSVTGAVFFEAYQPETPETELLSASKQTFVMYRQDDNRILMSICDPDLNIPELTYTTSKESQVKEKEIRLAGKYALLEKNPAVECCPEGENTLLKVQCKEGLPIEIRLLKK